MTLTDRRIRTRRRDERAMVGGGEGLFFVALLLVAGTVATVATWAVLHAQVATDGAAREYLRVFTEAPDPLTAGYQAELAARRSLSGSGLRPERIRVTPPDLRAFGPCAPATVELSVDLPGVRVPFLDALRSTTVRVRRSELIDARREMIAGPAYDPDRTACAG
ncbi:MAG: hypothetical protein ACOYML_04445 [Microthrixaceae bacterium]